MIGLGDAGKEGYFLLVIGPHFNDGYFGFLRQVEYGKGHAYVVVEITLGGPHPEFLLEGTYQQFLGGGFPIAARKAYHGDGELAPVEARQFLERFQGLGYLVVGVQVWVLCAADGGEGSFFEGLLQETVAVIVFPLKRYKKGARFKAPGIGRNAPGALVKLVKLGKGRHKIKSQLKITGTK
jgi:hypothetical protein